MKSESQVIVRPARNVRGSVSLPGDKSISHRYAMLAAIADGPSRLENYSTGADCANTLGCLRSLGVKWERKDGGDNIIEVQGLWKFRFDDPHAERDYSWAEILQ
jgi:3-phosphoshikimate 1-carboxyvinyltransferase